METGIVHLKRGLWSVVHFPTFWSAMCCNERQARKLARFWERVWRERQANV